MAASSNPPPSNRAALTTPYASLAPRPPTSSQSPEPPTASPSLAPKDGNNSARRTNPTWSDTNKARARACKTHSLARRPDGTCMACEREKKEARGSSRLVMLAAVVLAIGVGGAWFVSQQNQVSVNGARTAP